MRQSLKIGSSSIRKSGSVICIPYSWWHLLHGDDVNTERNGDIQFERRSLRASERTSNTETHAHTHKRFNKQISQGRCKPFRSRFILSISIYILIFPHHFDIQFLASILSDSLRDCRCHMTSVLLNCYSHTLITFNHPTKTALFYA